MNTIARALCLVALLGAAASRSAVQADGGVTVSLCDGQGTLTLPGLEPGKVLPPEQARQAAADMMQLWRQSAGEARWAAWTAETAAAAAAAAEPTAGAEGQPTKFTKRDLLLWQREEKKWVDEGYKAYHNAQALGGTIGISCDMCHPDGANTHAETYPKFQSQIKKVALLRDMINWCIENPLKGKPLPEDDARLRAVEAYILSTRKGVALEPGKH